MSNLNIVSNELSWQVFEFSEVSIFKSTIWVCIYRILTEELNTDLDMSMDIRPISFWNGYKNNGKLFWSNNHNKLFWISGKEYECVLKLMELDLQGRLCRFEIASWIIGFCETWKVNDVVRQLEILMEINISSELSMGLEENDLIKNYKQIFMNMNWSNFLCINNWYFFCINWSENEFMDFIKNLHKYKLNEQKIIDHERYSFIINLWLRLNENLKNLWYKYVDFRFEIDISKVEKNMLRKWVLSDDCYDDCIVVVWDENWFYNQNPRYEDIINAFELIWWFFWNRFFLEEWRYHEISYKNSDNMFFKEIIDKIFNVAKLWDIDMYPILRLLEIPFLSTNNLELIYCNLQYLITPKYFEEYDTKSLTKLLLFNIASHVNSSVKIYDWVKSIVLENYWNESLDELIFIIDQREKTLFQIAQETKSKIIKVYLNWYKTSDIKSDIVVWEDFIERNRFQNVFYTNLIKLWFFKKVYIPKISDVDNNLDMLVETDQELVDPSTYLRADNEILIWNPFHQMADVFVWLMNYSKLDLLDMEALTWIVMIDSNNPMNIEELFLEDWQLHIENMLENYFNSHDSGFKSFFYKDSWNLAQILSYLLSDNLKLSESDFLTVKIFLSLNRFENILFNYLTNRFHNQRSDKQYEKLAQEVTSFLNSKVKHLWEKYFFILTAPDWF